MATSACISNIPWASRRAMEERCHLYACPRLVVCSRRDRTPRCRAASDPFGEVSLARGFLPVFDPPKRLVGVGEAWEAALDEVPKLCVASGSSGVLRRTLADLPCFEYGELLEAVAAEDVCGGGRSRAQLWRAFMVVSFIAHAYMWCEEGPTPAVLPAVIAKPWASISSMLGMPPVLVYATYNLLNWRRLDPEGPIELGNIVCLNNFLGGVDEEWFRLVHVNIEAQAAPALAAIGPMKTAAAQGDHAGVEQGLAAITAALQAVQVTLGRMGEKCDPHTYYLRVRQPMAGWKGNAALPGGLVYEGVSEAPLQLYGETGAQSSVVPAFDASLGIRHASGWLQDYLAEMQLHMPPAHRAAIQQFADGPCVRSTVAGGPAALREAYNACVQELQSFRSQHRAFAHSYIAKFSKREETGTGGSDFMPALTGYRDTTRQHML